MGASASDRFQSRTAMAQAPRFGLITGGLLEVPAAIGCLGGLLILGKACLGGCAVFALGAAILSKRGRSLLTAPLRLIKNGATKLVDLIKHKK